MNLVGEARPTGPVPGRSRAANKALRRRQIITATIDSIAKHGFAETTIATVAKRAGLSQGVLIFHFKSKDALLVETLTYLGDEYRAAWRSALEAAGDRAGSGPIDRILALVEADFDPRICSRKKLAVWHAFFGEAKSRPTYLRICGAWDDERSAVMERLCAEALNQAALAGEAASPFDPESAAAAIDRLSDGLWLQLLMSDPRLGRARALRTVYGQLLVIFPAHAAAIRAARARNLGTESPGEDP